MKRCFGSFLSISIFISLQTGGLCAQTPGVAGGPSSFRMGFVRVKIQSQAEVKLIYGKISTLSQIKKVNIRYDRDSTKVYEYDSETAYLEHRCKDKDSATAKSIRQKWIYTHKEVCEPNFEDYFNRNANKIGIIPIAIII